jgi:ankyrin repeat protein
VRYLKTFLLIFIKNINMHKFKSFYIASVLFLALTGCYADRGQLENSNLNAEDQPQGEQDRIIPSYTTLYGAIKNKDLEKAIALLQEALKDGKEVNLMQRDGRGRSLLHFAIVNADPSKEVLYVEIVSLLIKLKQDVNARNNEANTPLHIAASKGLFLVVEELVKNGANIYAENKYEEIPLHYAVEGENIEVVRLLIDQNKTVEKTMRPLILPESDSYIDKKDNSGRTPLYLAMHKFGLCVDSPGLGNPENYVFIANFLLASGADVYTEDKYGTTLLHIAARNGCVEMVRMLLEEKVKVNPCDENSNSPLELAICCRNASARENDYFMVVNMLIEAGANVHHKNEYNYNLLHIAAAHQDVEVVKLLIDRKVEINSKSTRGYMPLYLAVSNAGTLVEQRCLEVIDLLIQAGAIIDVEGDNGYTPLYFAIKNGFGKIAIYLIKQGANINPKNSHSLLHDAIYACHLGRKDAYIAIIKYLISLGIGINNVDNKGNTPLHLAAQKLYIPGFQEVVNLLIEAGTDKDAVNNKGNPPLFYMKRYIKQILL